MLFQQRHGRFLFLLLLVACFLAGLIIGAWLIDFADSKRTAAMTAVPIS
jgi:hypothetical protein